MKASKLLRHLLPISALFISSPFIATALRAQEAESALADVKSASAKSQLKALDAEIDQLDALADNAPNADEKAAYKARIEALKDRRSELRKDYVQAKYDGLKADIRTEYNKAAAWTKKTFSSDNSSKVQADIEKVGDRAATATGQLAADAGAAVAPAAVAVSADIAAYKADPSKENKADVKAALANLDNEIKALDDRADALPKGEERDAVKLRVKALKDRRGELASDFRKARYDALKADVKAEWNKLIHKN